MNALDSKTVLVTGGTGGIGLHTAIGLAQRGAHLVITGRDKARGLVAVAEIIRASGNPHVELMLADLSVQAEVRQLADAFTATHQRLDVLVNNVGLLESTRRLTTDGIEAHFAVNVVAPFLLTHRLVDVLHASTPARVINVTGGLPNGKIDLENLQAQHTFRGMGTYSHAKRVMMAMSLVFARTLMGTGITVNIAYPGSAGTPMTRGMTADLLPRPARLFWPIFRLMMRDDGGKGAAKAARSSIYLATHPDVEGVTGNYYDTNSKLAKIPSSVANLRNQQRIWEALEQLTGIAAGPPATLGRSLAPARVGGAA